MTISLRARYVFPVEGPPIEDGVVTIAGGRILSVGRSTARPDRDLGSVALLPGLINAHTHLEFSRLDSPLGRPHSGMAQWIQSVIAYRRSGQHDAAAGVAAGLCESHREGVVALGEIAQPDTTATIPADVPLHVLSFVELIAPTASRTAAAQQAALAHLDAPFSCPRVRLGLSPHAPYTVHPELLDWAVETARRRGVPLAIHLAESADEMQWLQTGTGPLAELLLGIDGFRPEAFAVGRRPLAYLQRLAAAPRTLVIHGNYLGDEEIAFLAAQRERFSVVYCPRTHAYFGHAPYPLARLLAAGVNVALGTDSRASSPDLSLLTEMREAAARHSNVPPEAIVRMATLGGAVALDVADSHGSLAPGKRADMIAVALPERGDDSPYALLLAGEGRVVARSAEESGGLLRPGR